MAGTAAPGQQRRDSSGRYSSKSRGCDDQRSHPMDHAGFPVRLTKSADPPRRGTHYDMARHGGPLVTPSLLIPADLPSSIYPARFTETAIPVTISPMVTWVERGSRTLGADAGMLAAGATAY